MYNKTNLVNFSKRSTVICILSIVNILRLLFVYKRTKAIVRNLQILIKYVNIDLTFNVKVQYAKYIIWNCKWHALEPEYSLLLSPFSLPIWQCHQEYVLAPKICRLIYSSTIIVIIARLFLIATKSLPLMLICLQNISYSTEYRYAVRQSASLLPMVKRTLVIISYHGGRG